ncbi:MAG: hypothetical protein BEN19_03090 [Epulopiscium sp. Nuni2H_MBin003]|nr:MAG: hypothetical protein BEN19_03090 [Epulopiscium sp. Nuni2H_MBin003]
MSAKRIISLMLAFVMVIGICPTIYATPLESEYSIEASNTPSVLSSATNITKKQYQLPENLNNFTGDNTYTFSSGWAGIIFDYTNDNTYTLEYYVVDNTNKLVKMVHEFKIGNNNEHYVITNVYRADDGGTAEQMVDGQYQVYNNASSRYVDFDFGYNPDEELVPDSAVTNMDIVTTTNSDSNFKGDSGNVVAVLSTGIEFRYIIDSDTNKIHFTTNSVNNGNVVDFKITGGQPYGTDGGQELSVLTALSNFGATPTHYVVNENGEIENSKYIYSPEVAGNRPGFDVQFDHPKQISEDYAGVYTLDLVDGGEEITASLILTSYSESKNIDIRFDFAQTESDVTVFNSPDEGTKFYEDGVHTLKIVADETLGVDATTHPDLVEELNNEFLQWDELTMSELMNNAQSYIQISTTSPTFTSSRYYPTDPIYTYLEYYVNRESTSAATIEFDAYKGLGTSTVSYTVYNNEPTGNSVIPEDQYKIASVLGGNSTKIPVIFNSNTDDNRYYIVVNFNGLVLVSQVYLYDGTEEVLITPPTPQIESISNVYVVPPESDDDINKAYAIGFDMKWTAPTNSTYNRMLNEMLEEGTLYYEMMLYESQADAEIQDEAERAATRIYSKVFEVEFDDPESQVIELNPYLGEAGTKVGVDDNGNDIKQGVYSEVDGSFTMEDIEIKSYLYNGNDNKINRLLTFPDGYLEDVDYIDKDSGIVEEKPDVAYEIPSTYYVTIRAVFDYDNNNDGTEEKKLQISNESNMYSLTFNPKEEILPIVSSISHTEYLEQGINQISFNVVDIRDYIDLMLEPVHWDFATMNGVENKNLRTYEVFLYQQAEPSANTAATENNFNPDTNLVVERNNSLSIGTLTADVTQTSSTGETFIDEIRAGETVKIEYVDDVNVASSSVWPVVDITGLDENQTYYVKIRVKIESGDSSVDPHYSGISKELTFTTHTDPKPPTPDEQKPPAPGDIWIVEDDNIPSQTAVKLGWEAPVYSTEYEMFYELIRSTDGQADVTLLDSSLSLSEIISEENTIIGFDTREQLVRTYTAENLDGETLDPMQYSAALQLTDITLIPNKVYYYYVRTVVIVDGVPVSSEWINIPVTTSPLAKPINLSAEKVSDYYYDPTSEVVISFLGPIPEDAEIPTDYDFEFIVKGEDDSDYILAGEDSKYTVTPMIPVTVPNTTPMGYQYYVYKIENLNSNSRYDIKIRVVDYVTEVDEGEERPRSGYSDTLVYRTDLDETDENNKAKLEEMLDLYDDLTADLSNSPYWIIKQTNNSAVYKYKNSYLKSELVINDVYKLEGGTNSLDYYFPASTFETANENNTMIQVEIDEFTLTIRPNTINSAIKEVNKVMSATAAGTLDDYYIRLSLDTQKIDNVNYQPALTQEFVVGLEVVELKTEDVFIEIDIEQRMSELITLGRVEAEDELRIEIENADLDNTELEELVAEIVYEISLEHQSDAKEILEYAIQGTERIISVSNKMLLETSITGSNIVAYYYNDGWKSIFSFQLPSGYALEIEDMGSYAFSGTLVVDFEIPTIAGSSIINKYGLGEIFNLTTGLEQTATKQQVYDAVAKVLNAPDGVNSVLYLQNSGLQGITSANLNSGIRQDEAIFVLMQLYEKVTYRSVSQIVITDRQSVTNIGAFTPIYREYVYAGVQLGFVQTVDAQVYPSQPLKVSEVIDIMVNIVK